VTLRGYRWRRVVRLRQPRSAARSVPILVELLLPDGDVYSVHVLQPGDTLRVSLRRAVRKTRGGGEFIIDVPVHIRARIA